MDIAVYVPLSEYLKMEGIAFPCMGHYETLSLMKNVEKKWREQEAVVSS